MINKTKLISYDFRVRFFWFLVSLSLLSFSLYIYAINATARNVATGQNSERQILKISAGLDTLEFAYIKLKNSVTMELADQYGFTEEKAPLFVSRTPQASLSFNTLKR